MVKKTEEAVASKCPISRKDFITKAKPLSIRVGETLISGDVKEFSTGSFGFFSNGKLTVEIDGVPVKMQMNLLFTVIGSKELE